jgi:hypothetical protein
MSTGLVLMSTATSASADEKQYWQGNGKENLPCDGDLHWIWTGNSTTPPVLHVGGVTDTGEQGGNGKGAWHFWTDGDVDPVVGETHVTYTGDPGKGNTVLTISHCEEGDDDDDDGEPEDKTVPVPGDPSVKDPCGPDNIEFVVPTDTDTVEWKLVANGRVLQAKTVHGYKFDDGKKVKFFDLPEDSNEPCDEPEEPEETSTPSSPEPSVTTPPANPPANPPAPPAVVPPVVGGTESAAPEPKPEPQPGQVKGSESSKPKPKANKPKADRPAVVLGTEAAVPTAVDAGLGSLPGAAPAQGSPLGQLLTGAGIALMLAAGWLMTMGRRKVGAREA